MLKMVWWKMVCDGVVCGAKPRAKDGAEEEEEEARGPQGNEGGCHQMPRLPRKTKVDVTICNSYHACRR